MCFVTNNKYFKGFWKCIMHITTEMHCCRSEYTMLWSEAPMGTHAIS